MLTPLLKSPWWDYSVADLRDHWPEPLSASGSCTGAGTPCDNYSYSPVQDTRICTHVFTFSPDRDSGQWALAGVYLSFRASSVVQALELGDRFVHELSLPPGSLQQAGSAWEARASKQLDVFERTVSAKGQKTRSYSWGLAPNGRQAMLGLSVDHGVEGWRLFVSLGSYVRTPRNRAE